MLTYVTENGRRVFELEEAVSDAALSNEPGGRAAALTRLKARLVMRLTREALVASETIVYRIERDAMMNVTRVAAVGTSVADRSVEATVGMPDPDPYRDAIPDVREWDDLSDAARYDVERRVAAAVDAEVQARITRAPLVYAGANALRTPKWIAPRAPQKPPRDEVPASPALGKRKIELE